MGRRPRGGPPPEKGPRGAPGGYFAATASRGSLGRGLPAFGPELFLRVRRGESVSVPVNGFAVITRGPAGNLTLRAGGLRLWKCLMKRI